MNIMDSNQYNNNDQNIYYEQPGQQYQQPGQQYYQQPQQQYYQPNPYQAVGQAASQVRDLLQNEVIAKSFLYMVAALAVTAIAAFTAPDLLAGWLMRGRYNFIILFVAELAIVIASNVAMSKNNVALSAILFTLYSYLTGATLGIIFWAYQLASVGAIFLMTAAMFGIMAVYGLVTKKDLSSIGNICMMGIIGIIIASLVNIFLLKSGVFDLIVSVSGVAIFVGLTAYDVQKIKRRVYYATDENVACLALWGAFGLYLDFINLFLRLLRLFGKRK